MSPFRPTTFQVLVDPELAVLYALCATLDVTRQALLAAHPALEHEDFEDERPMELEAAGWLADSIITHINGLEVAVQSYHQEVQRARGRSELDDLPF
jgi:hypothetical protein